MRFQKSIIIPDDRIGVLIGKSGQIKAHIEKTCSVSIEIDSGSGQTMVTATGENAEDMLPLKAFEIVTAIARGFSPEHALNILKEDYSLHLIDLRDYVGKSQSQLHRVKARIIGEHGRARKHLEELSGTHVCVYGKTVAVIGSQKQLKVAVNAIVSLTNGSMHGTVYKSLQDIRTRQKQERMILWENGNVAK